MKVNQLKIGVLLSYVTMGLQLAVQLFYTPVMIRLLGQSEYGLYTLVGSVVSYLSLFSLGFTGAYLRFYARYKSNNDKTGGARLNGMFLALFLGMAALALVCGFVLAQHTTQLFGPRLTPPELAKSKILMLILVVNIAMTFPASLFNSILSAHEEFLVQRLLALAGVVFSPFICLPLLLAGHGSVTIVTVTTLLTAARLVLAVFYCLHRLRTPFSFARFDPALLCEMASFSFFIFLNMLIDQLNWTVDKLILGRLAGTVSVAIYGVGANINNMFLGFTTAVSAVFAPRINLIAASTPDPTLRNARFTELFIRIGRLQLIIVWLIASGLIFFGRFFITDLYATAAYLPAYAVSLLLVLPTTIPAVQNLGLEIQRSVNKHRFRSVCYLIIAVVNTAISIPLARAFGPVGAAAGTTFAMLLGNGLIMNIYYHKGIGIDIPAFWKNLLVSARALIPPFVLGFLILRFVTFHGFLDFLLWILLYIALYLLSFWLLSMNADEKALLTSALRRLSPRS